ncbi:MAG: hotdog fold domain-containing protein, partial [Gemmatimonadetes bacterium]|nr:hotdog fold domain-containing protein [Gemmatimonadota bacterium]
KSAGPVIFRAGFSSSLLSHRRYMGRSFDTAGPRLLAIWTRLSPLPGGRWLFNRRLGLMIPYTGTIKPRVLELRPGYAKIALRDRRRVRNHLNSIHAIAMANLGEVASGLAMSVGLPANIRGIPTKISIEYLKKARGTLIAESQPDIPPVTTDIDHIVEAEIRDGTGDVVARLSATWKLSPR